MRCDCQRLACCFRESWKQECLKLLETNDSQCVWTLNKDRDKAELNATEMLLFSGSNDFCTFDGEGRQPCCHMKLSLQEQWTCLSSSTGYVGVLPEVVHEDDDDRQKQFSRAQQSHHGGLNLHLAAALLHCRASARAMAQGTAEPDCSQYCQSFREMLVGLIKCCSFLEK